MTTLSTPPTRVPERASVIEFCCRVGCLFANSTALVPTYHGPPGEKSVEAMKEVREVSDVRGW